MDLRLYNQPIQIMQRRKALRLCNQSISNHVETQGIVSLLFTIGHQWRKTLAMADLHIFHPHNTSKEQALRKLQDLAPALISKYGVHVSWNGYSLRFNRSGVSGTATVRERDIELNLDISWYLAIFRPQIEQGVRQQLSKYFP